MQYLPRDLHITAIHIYAVRPEYCHEHHLWEKLGPNTRENENVDPLVSGTRRAYQTSGRKPFDEPFIQGLDIVNNKKFEATWREGLWLGHSRSSNEVLVGNDQGVVRVACFRSCCREDGG